VVLEERFGVDDGAVDTRHGYYLQPLLEGLDDSLKLLLILLLIRVDYHGEVKGMQELFIFFFEDFNLVVEFGVFLFLFLPHEFPPDHLLTLHQPQLLVLLELSALVVFLVDVL